MNDEDRPRCKGEGCHKVLISHRSREKGLCGMCAPEDKKKRGWKAPRTRRKKRMPSKPNCLKCVANCAIHALRCEEATMQGRDSIDCETFIEGDRSTLPPPPKIHSVRELTEMMC